MRQHHYTSTVQWTGNTGEGTKTYRSYERDHVISKKDGPDIPGSSDPAFRGNASRYSPEDLLMASISACHMLWFLHLATEAGVIVTGYIDKAEGVMVETSDGGGHFEQVVLKPAITVSGQPSAAVRDAVHHKAHKLCFIANSCNFPVLHEPEYRFE